jgi:hypothetical protein
MRSKISGDVSARGIRPLAVIPEEPRDSKQNDTDLSSDAGFSSDGDDSPQAKRNNELELHGFDFSRQTYEHANPVTNVMKTSSELRVNIDQTVRNTMSKDTVAQ